MNADLAERDGGPTPGPAPAQPPAPGGGTPVPPAPPVAPAVRLAKRTAAVRGRAATIPVRCTGADCAGRLTLRAGGRKLGAARFAARAGETARVRVKLNRAGRRLLARRRTVAAVARITFTAGAGEAASLRLRLRRASAG